MDDLIKVSVSEVRPAVPAGAGVEAGMVVLLEDVAPRRSLRIIVGQPEARAIQLAWKGQISARPLTWDLLLSVADLLGGSVTRAVITAVEERRHFYAQLELDCDGELHRLACRPSDAIALAVRVPGAEIVCRPEVLEAAGDLPPGELAAEW